MKHAANRVLDRETTRGFSLIELLVVITIITVLGGVLLFRLNRGVKEDVKIQATKTFIASISTAMEVYRNDRNIGVYPPTSFENFPGAGRLPNRTNLGVETLVVCLNSPGFTGDRIIDRFDDLTENTDADSSARALTIYASNELFELLDHWGNPLVYFHCADYSRLDVRQYLAASEPGGDRELVTVEPKINPKTKSPFNLQSYQLFSAGPDMKFGTEDDVGNW